MPILNGKKVVDLEIDGVDSAGTSQTLLMPTFQVDAMKMEHH